MEKKLIDLIKMNFDLDDFYSIEINRYVIALQGPVSDELLAKYIKKGYVFNFYENRYRAQLDNIIIVFL